MKSVGRDSVEPKLDCLGKSRGSKSEQHENAQHVVLESRPTVIGGEVERAEPMRRATISSVLRPDAVATRHRQGFLLRLAHGGPDGGKVGDSERRRYGAQRHPPPPLGLSRAHIPARQTGPEFGVARRLTQIPQIQKRKAPHLVMRQYWMVGRAVPCPPHDGGATLLPLAMPDGGQRSARPTFPVPPETDALLLPGSIAGVQKENGHLDGVSARMVTKRTKLRLDPSLGLKGFTGI